MFAADLEVTILVHPKGEHPYETAVISSRTPLDQWNIRDSFHYAADVALAACAQWGIEHAAEHPPGTFVRFNPVPH